MLRINLLPAYIAERRKTRAAIVMSTLLFLAVTGGLLAYNFGVLQPAVAAREQEAADQEAIVAQVKDLETKIQEETTKATPYKEKVGFVKEVHFQNTIRSKIYRNAARYTDPKVEYSSMAANANVLSMNAYVRSLDDLGRMYITMFGNPDVNAVSISGIPGYPMNRTQTQTFGGYNPQTNQAPSQASQWWPVQVVATLIRPIVTPQLPASLQATQAGFGGMGGMGGGPMMGGPMMSGPSMSGPSMGAPATDPGDNPAAGGGGAPAAPDGGS